MSFNERIAKLNKMIADAQYIVFFTGAGISTGSGIPDFRSSDGLYTTSEEDEPEYMLSHTCLNTEPQRFFEYMRKNMDFRKAEPNIAHLKISELQRARTVSVITQNIDGLHEKAGSKVIDNIRGTMAKWYCPGCFHDQYDHNDVMDGNFDDRFGVPRCPLCGNEFIIRPSITLYEEELPGNAWFNAQLHAGAADLMIVVGSSLTVSPANHLPFYFGNPKQLVLINRDPAPFGIEFGLEFHEDIGKVFERIEIPE